MSMLAITIMIGIAYAIEKPLSVRETMPGSAKLKPDIVQITRTSVTPARHNVRITADLTIQLEAQVQSHSRLDLTGSKSLIMSSIMMILMISHGII